LHQQIGLTFKEETNKVLHLEYNFVWCWDLDTVDSDQKYMKVLKCGAGEG
jgi:hypothetical protein